MLRVLLILTALLPLAACDLNPLQGKPSKFQKYQERKMAVEKNRRAQVVYVAQPQDDAEVCVPEFRVVEC